MNTTSSQETWPKYSLFRSHLVWQQVWKRSTNLQLANPSKDFTNSVSWRFCGWGTEWQHTVTDYTPDKSSGQMFSLPPPDTFSCFATLQKLIKIKKKNRGRIWMFPRVSQLESTLCSDEFEWQVSRKYVQPAWVRKQLDGVTKICYTFYGCRPLTQVSLLQPHQPAYWNTTIQRYVIEVTNKMQFCFSYLNWN